MSELFCSGDAMRGGRLHHNVAAHPFVGAATTAPHYRLWSVRDAFPALELVAAGGAGIAGEVYDVPLHAIRTAFLPDEPAELELTVIELAGGHSVLAVGLRPEVDRGALTDITHHGGWRAYRGLPDPEETPR